MQGSSFNIYIVDRPQINAFVLPSTDVFVYTGLLSVADDENLLAAVLAHEISHCVERQVSADSSATLCLTLSDAACRSLGTLSRV